MTKNIFWYFYTSYPQDLPYCKINEEFLKRAADYDYQAHLVTSRQHDSKKVKEHYEKLGIEVHFLPNLRMPKGISYFWFAFISMLHIACCAKGTVVVSSTPPVIMGFFSLIGKLLSIRKITLVYHVQDIHPEALNFSSYSINIKVLRLLRWLDSMTLTGADLVVTLSEDMLNTMKRRGKKIKAIICNNPIHSQRNGESICEDVLLNSGYTRFIFSGNVGRFQGLLPLVEAFCSPLNQHACLYILGGGDDLVNIKQYLETVVTDKVILLGKVSSSKAQSITAQADYGVVSLTTGMLSVAYPSKVITYLQLGLPVLAVCDENSELAKMLINSRAGLAVNSESMECMLTTIEALVETNYNRQEIMKTCNETFDKEKITRRFFNALPE